MPEAPPPGPAASVGRDWILWAALAISLSPVLVDLVRHFQASPWSAYALIFAPLCIALGRRQTGRRAPAWDGYLWLGVTTIASLIAAGGGIPRLARPLLPLGVLGIARLRGHPAPSVAALSVFCIPLPNQLPDWLGATAWCAPPLARLAGSSLRPWAWDGKAWWIPGWAIPTESASAGLHCFALGAGIALFALLRERADSPAWPHKGLLPASATVLALAALGWISHLLWAAAILAWAPLGWIAQLIALSWVTAAAAVAGGAAMRMRWAGLADRRAR